MTDFTLSGLPAGTAATIEIRAVNAIGPGPASDAKTVTPSDVPGAFAAGAWSVAPGEGEAVVTVASLPAANGKPITAVDYRLDGAAWTASGLSGPGSFTISGLTGGRAYAVRLRARNANGAGVPGDTKNVTPTASASGTDPNVTAIQADGWRASYSNPPAAFDPVGDPKPVVVERPGFDATGAPVTVTETLVVMARVREPYPNEGTLTPNDVALSDFVYQGDRVQGAVNNSTRAYPKPIAMWLDHDLRRVRGQSYTARLAVAHGHARAGRPVAAVKFIATDGSATVETIVSSMTPISYAASGLTVPHFATTLDLSGLASDQLITIDAVIYPWVGEAFTISTDADPYPSPNLTVMKVFNDVSYGTAYAYVDASVGDDGAGVASPTVATAAASPFATIAAAASALQSYNDANFGRNSASGGVIRLEEGTHTHSKYSSVAVSDMPLEIEAAGAKAATIYQDAGASISNGCPDLLKISGVTLKRNASTNVIFLDSGSAAGPDHLLVLEDCDFDDGGFGLYGGWIYRTGRYWMLNCKGSRCGQAAQVGSVPKLLHAIGSSGECVGRATYFAAGCHDPMAVYRDVKTNAVLAGGFVGFCHLGQGENSDRIVNIELAIDERGLALVGNVIEHYGGDTVPACFISADGVTAPAVNVVRMANTVVGSRTNLLYNDSGDTAIPKLGHHRFNLDWQRNLKTDVFGRNENLVGNWPAAYKVGWRGDATLTGAVSNSANGTGSWLGEIAALGERNVVSGDFADDRSFQAGGAGGGDYTPGAGHAVPTIPAGLAPWSHDQKGRPLPDDGSGIAGALQPL